MTFRTRTWLPCTLALMFGASAARAGVPPGLFKLAVKSVNALELPDLGGDESEAYDINNAGQIVGYSQNQNAVDMAFLYQPSGSIQYIGTSGVLQEESYATGINNNSEVVGVFRRGGTGRPFYWHSSTGLVKLSINLFPGQSYNDKFYFLPQAINDHGFIVGAADGHEPEIPYDNCHANVPIYWPAPNQDPQVLYCTKDKWGPNKATDVNNTGWIAGFEVAATDYGFVYKPNGTGGLIYVPPVNPDRRDQRVYGINEAGTLAGTAPRIISNVIQWQASLWEGPSFTHKHLGVLSGGKYSQADEINDQNFVAGSSEKGIYLDGALLDVVNRAFVWHADFGMYNLPTPVTIHYGSPATECRANAINNQVAERGGWVVQVIGYCKQGVLKRAVRWNVRVALVPPQPGPL